MPCHVPVPRVRKRATCRYWRKGHCHMGPKCNFSHADYFRTSLCPHFKNGRCPRADCTFAHGEEQRRSSKDQSYLGQGALDAFRRTRVCRQWREGQCPFGKSCSFSHAETATENCYHWHEGRCKYGSRCNFRHDRVSAGHDQTCRQWRRGYCRDGARCDFRHDTVHGQEAAPSTRNVGSPARAKASPWPGSKRAAGSTNTAEQPKLKRPKPAWPGCKRTATPPAEAEADVDASGGE